MAEEQRGDLVRSFLDGNIGRRVFVKSLLASGITAAAAFAYADVLAPRTARAAAAARSGGDLRGGIGQHLPNGFYNFYTNVTDNHFGNPSITVYRRGDSVSWGFNGPKDHSVTESSGLDFFDSGYAPHTRIMYSMVFPAAGSFPYHCKDPNHASSMKGVVHVKVGRTPANGQLGTHFTIKWAQKPADPGYVFDVQKKNPGGTFKAWKNGVTTAQAPFTPGQTGQFFFRGRVRSKLTGLASGFSPPSSIVVF